MGTLSLRSNLLLAAAAAVALLAALGLPWYGPPPAAGEATIENLFQTTQRMFTEEGVTGATSLGTAATVLEALAALLVLACALSLVASLEDFARMLLSTGSMAAVALVVVKIFDQPGANEAVDLRYGAFVALVAAGFAVSAAGAVAAKPKLRKPPPRMVDARAGRSL